MSGFVRRYGASPLHLLSTVTCFALAGYAVLQATGGPRPLRMAIWFVGALVAHDLILFPLYALADRGLTRVLPSRRRPLGVRGLNYVRVPVLLSGLLFLLFFPLILRRSEGPYGNASGLDQSPYLGNWLLITALLFGASAVAYAVAVSRRRVSA
ncbi:MAG: hypothetical protein ABIO67_07810 [Mycobacteriales bacterium]